MLRRALRVLVAAAAVAAPLIAAAMLPERGPALCGFRVLLGIPCPGCGLTRSLAALVRLDPVAAFTVHPIGPPFLAYLGLLWASAWVRWARGGTLSSPVAKAIPGAVHLGIVGVMFVVWIARFGGAFGGPASPVDPGASLLLARLF